MDNGQLLSTNPTAEPLFFVRPLPNTFSAAELPRRHSLAAAVHALWRHPRSRWALLSSLLAPASVVWAQTTEEPLRLQMSNTLLERLPVSAQRQAPSFVYGDRIHGQSEVSTVVEGHAELRRHDMVIRADHLEYQQPADTAIAQGNVRINRQGNVYEGPELKLKMDTFEGYFLQPRFSILQRRGLGDASRLDFVNENTSVAHTARYSTCQRDPAGDWLPAWMVSADRIEFDMAEETGTATNGVLSFKGVPLLAAPWVSFPLSDRRKSGLLPPTINLDNQSGLEYQQPYYINVAPNRDVTLFPTLMSKRGFMLGGEFRYLEPEYAGTARAAYMPSDKLRDADRWSYSLRHRQALDTLTSVDNLGLQLNLNRVSDDNYWRDFTNDNVLQGNNGVSLQDRLLPSNAALTWGQGAWSASAGIYEWQTLQDTSAPIVPPYDRRNLTVRYAPSSFELMGTGGWETAVTADTTRFTSTRLLSDTSADGTRHTLTGSVSKTWQTPGWYIKPALQLNLRQYQFDQTYSSAAVNRNSSESFVVPTFTFDSGLQLERDTSYLGRAFVQTLEPRLYYVRTPYRDQSMLPLYDTAAYDFNMATVFMPSPYAGQDRIADLNTLTLGATSRLIDPETGQEVLSLGVAQRLRFSDQLVTLPTEAPITDRLSDLLIGGRVQVNDRWSLNGSMQVNTESNQSVRTTLGARYTPSNYRVLSTTYRLKEGTSEQIDFAWQWPLSDLFGPSAPDKGPGRGLGPGHWYSVGRLNYSMLDKKIVDMIAGFEYDAGCWIGRVVLERLQQSTTSANQRILFQLEFSDFSRIGSSPLQTLKDNVPRYQFLREEVTPPSRFERYE